MRGKSLSRSQQACRWCLVLLLGVMPPVSWALDASPAAALRAQFEQMRRAAVEQPLGPAVFLSSIEGNDRLQGEVLALIDHPFSSLRQALDGTAPWCQILILHLNVKYCRALDAGPGRDAVLDVGVGRKFDQPLADVHWARFSLRGMAVADDHLAIELRAPSGPMGTHDYLISVAAAPFDATHSVMRMRYSYGMGLAGKLAMQAYLATLGSDKVGFSVLGRQPDGQPERVGGVRGIVERNTLRYYLAIQSHLGALRLPPPERQQKSLEDWFDATERHPLQLHEMDRAGYLEMKRRELQRQQTEAPPQRD